MLESHGHMTRPFLIRKYSKVFSFLIVLSLLMFQLAWAPGKGMKGKEYKDYWEVEQGVSYIPWSKISTDVDLELLEEGGMIDEESFPEWLKGDLLFIKCYK